MNKFKKEIKKIKKKAARVLGLASLSLLSKKFYWSPVPTPAREEVWKKKSRPGIERSQKDREER